jgi:L-threonylcarbamoyladenylate synthase
MENTMPVQETVIALKSRKTILFPTDTVWGIGGDATQSAVVSAIYDLKQREESKALLCLMKDTAMLSMYFDEIPKEAFALFEADRPTTVILDHPKGIAQNMLAADKSLAVRIPKDPFCQALLAVFQRPIIATSANSSGQPSPEEYRQIEKTVLEGVDYVVPLKQTEKMVQPSRILKVSAQGNITVIRD